MHVHIAACVCASEMHVHIAACGAVRYDTGTHSFRRKRSCGAGFLVGGSRSALECARHAKRAPGHAAAGVSGSSGEKEPGCPSWCQLPPGHVAGRRSAGGVTHAGLVREVYLDEIDAIREAADEPARVELEAFAGPDGREHPPTVKLTLSSAASPNPDSDDLTLAEAEELACGLLEAVRLARS
jgi:hypothetical protein